MVSCSNIFSENLQSSFRGLERICCNLFLQCIPGCIQFSLPLCNKIYVPANELDICPWKVFCTGPWWVMASLLKGWNNSRRGHFLGTNTTGGSHRCWSVSITCMMSFWSTLYHFVLLFWVLPEIWRVIWSYTHVIFFNGDTISRLWCFKFVWAGWYVFPAMSAHFMFKVRAVDRIYYICVSGLWIKIMDLVRACSIYRGGPQAQHEPHLSSSAVDNSDPDVLRSLHSRS